MSAPELADGTYLRSLWALLGAYRVQFLVSVAGLVLLSAGLLRSPWHVPVRWLLCILPILGLEAALFAKRPYGHTVVEMTATLGALALATACLLPNAAQRAAVCVTSLLALATIQPASYVGYSKAYSENGRLMWHFHDRLHASSLPVSFLLPDNRYALGTVEEALLKGLADFPTWSIPAGLTTFARLGIDLSFLHRGDPLPRDADAYPRVIGWIDHVQLEPALDTVPHARAAVDAIGTRCEHYPYATYGDTPTATLSLCVLPTLPAETAPTP